MELSVDVLLPTRAPAPWLAEALDGLNAQVGCTWRLIAVVHGDPGELTPLILARVPDAVIVPLPSDARLQDLLNAGLDACTLPPSVCRTNSPSPYSRKCRHRPASVRCSTRSRAARQRWPNAS